MYLIEFPTDKCSKEQLIKLRDSVLTTTKSDVIGATCRDITMVGKRITVTQIAALTISEVCRITITLAIGGITYDDLLTIKEL